MVQNSKIFILFSIVGLRNMVQNSTNFILFLICWIPKYGSKFDKIENEYTKARGIFYDLSDFASGRCRKPGPEPTEPRKQKNYSEPLSEWAGLGRSGPVLGVWGVCGFLGGSVNLAPVGARI